ncbi:MAG TPA: phage/plasmid primase, P4 family [Acidimicrobiales bacterium]|nr:phage/plasmid primase, P4 family [Acidimicrobiales bacterium]
MTLQDPAALMSNGERAWGLAAARGDLTTPAAVDFVANIRWSPSLGADPELAAAMAEGDRRNPSRVPDQSSGPPWRVDVNEDPATAVALSTLIASAVNDPLPAEPKTELGYARRFIHVYGARLRYVPPWRQWLVWDGTRWAHDIDGQAQRWMKTIARRITTDALAIADPDRRKAALREAKRGESSAGVAGALTLASTEPEVAIVPDALDVDPFLLNCANGTLDLRTGELHAHDPGQLLTKVTAAAYRPDHPGTVFPGFLERIQPDPDMRRFLARLLGHALEGRQAVHLLPIFHGDGANGKSTLVNAVDAALGDYAAPADPDLLFARSFDAHPTSNADLFGLRLAVLHEGDAGRRLAEGTVKRLTGGDAIKARRMREDFWSFTPSHTFVMLTNHRPLVSGSDEGIWRRLRLVPFQVVIPLAERDDDLAAKLGLEADAILAWLVTGYLDWRTHGLDEPAPVAAATAAYKAESDALGRFLDERCLLGPHHRARSSDLYNTWTRWCTTEGEEPGTNKAFTTQLQNRGFDTQRTKVGAVFVGVGIATESEG